MAEKDPRLEAVIKSLEVIKQKLPNGELEVIKKSLEALSNDQKVIRDDIEYLKKRLFNPDDGVIVRINKNTENLNRFEGNTVDYPEIKSTINAIEKWKNGVNKALWIVYTSLVGIIISIIFSVLQGKL